MSKLTAAAVNQGVVKGSLCFQDVYLYDDPAVAKAKDFLTKRAFSPKKEPQSLFLQFVDSQVCLFVLQKLTSVRPIHALMEAYVKISSTQCPVPALMGTLGISAIQVSIIQS